MRQEELVDRPDINEWCNAQRTAREEKSKVHNAEGDTIQPGLTEDDYCSACHTPYYINCQSNGKGWKTWKGLCPQCTVSYLNSNITKEGKDEKHIEKTTQHTTGYNSHGERRAQYISKL